MHWHLAALPLTAALTLAACAQNGSPEPSAAENGSEASRQVVQSGCFALSDFSADDSGWRRVDDTVMGGRSTSALTVKDGAMMWNGALNTDGGGFVSIRLPIAKGALAGVTKLKIKARSDGRAYRFTMQTDERVRTGAPVSFGAPIEGLEAGKLKWGEADLTETKATFRGRKVRDALFMADDVGEIGLILADGEDGPFRLIVERIEACRP